MLRDHVKILHVAQDDGRILAAAFEHDALEVRFGGILQEASACLGRAREADHADVGVAPQRFADLAAAAGQHVEYPGRHAGFALKYRSSREFRRRTDSSNQV